MLTTRKLIQLKWQLNVLNSFLENIGWFGSSHVRNAFESASVQPWFAGCKSFGSSQTVSSF